MNLNSFFIKLFYLTFIGLCLFSSCGSSAVPERSSTPSQGILDEDTDLSEDSQWQDFGNIIVNRDLRDFIFFPAQGFLYYAAPGVGNLADHQEHVLLLSNNERQILSRAFESAYIDALIRNMSLIGILGGDQVHRWPEENPISWVQNWETQNPEPNSWGLDSMILAIHNQEISERSGQQRVFTVHGQILDFYGMGFGIGGANGNTGYGAPRGEEFFYNNSIAQRFDLGLILIDENGQGSFIPETPPSEELIIPDNIGVFSARIGNEDIQNAFLSAWKLGVDRGIESLIPDGTGQYINITGNSHLLGFSAGDQNIDGLYLQTFNNRSKVLLLVDSPGLPPHARFLDSPFLDILLATDRYNLDSGTTLRPQNIRFTGGDNFARLLMRGFAIFGVPLSDPVPQKITDNMLNEVWINTQRFSLGWLLDTGQAR